MASNIDDTDDERLRTVVLVALLPSMTRFFDSIVLVGGECLKVPTYGFDLWLILDRKDVALLPTEPCWREL